MVVSPTMGVGDERDTWKRFIRAHAGGLAYMTYGGP
jgi:hypothetical protein